VITAAPIADVAAVDLRLSRYLGASEDIWLGLQAANDLVLRRDELGSEPLIELRQLAREPLLAPSR
jgi:plasmid maintenance system antidote protein VapI